MSEGVISATLIRHPRKDRSCDTCGIPLGLTVRLYGCANHGDPKYALYICRGCAERSHDPKVLEVLA